MFQVNLPSKPITVHTAVAYFPAYFDCVCVMLLFWLRKHGLKVVFVLVRLHGGL